MGDVYRADFSNRTWDFDVYASTALFSDIIPDDVSRQIRESGTEHQQLHLGRLAENLEALLLANEGLLSRETRHFFSKHLSAIVSLSDTEADLPPYEENQGQN